MPRPCSICGHPRRTEIDRELSEGVPLRTIAERYVTSTASLSRHTARCLEFLRIKELAELNPTLEIVESPDRFDVYADLVTLRRKACDLLAKAEEDDNGAWTMMFAMRELRQIATDMVKVYEAQKRIETMYAPVETVSASGIYLFLRDRYPKVLAEMVEFLDA